MFDSTKRRAIRRALRALGENVTPEEVVEKAKSRAKTPWTEEVVEKALEYARKLLFNEEETYYVVEESASDDDSFVTIRVKDDEIDVDPKKVNVELIRQIAKDHRLSKYVVLLNGKEIKNPLDFPEEVPVKAEIRLIPYDEWGVR